MSTADPCGPRSAADFPDGLIAAVEAELAEVRARRPPPAPPEWKVEGIRTGSGLKGLRVHAGDCSMGRGKPADAEQVRRMLAEGVEPCPYCSPDNLLGVPG